MTPEEIKEEVLRFKWEFWFDRPFGAFLMSFWDGGQSREYMRKAGVDAEWPAIIFQYGKWYRSEEVWSIFEGELQKYLDEGGDVFEVGKQCEELLEKGKKKIAEVDASKKTNQEKLRELHNVLTQTISHVWLAHGFEYLYEKILYREVPKYYSGDTAKFIGDISYPARKNAHYYFEQALRSEMTLEKVREEFGWIKARGGFADGFTIEELASERVRLQKKPFESEKFIRPEIPEPLQELAKIVQELVYYRTLRTDILYELMWFARPLMTKIAESFGLTFGELRDYCTPDLLAGKKDKYEYDQFTAISLGKDFVFFHKPILLEKVETEKSELKGAVAFKGKARGNVKIVKIAHEIGKGNEGDILVAPTTAPSFIIGMQRAAAFVTDEGGITSHAAIVSREMRKPCIIGTKIATQVLKDGDVVEVDAEQGIVKLLKR